MKTSRGFTLVELIVSVGLFAIISALAAGGYLITLAAARHAEIQTIAVDNLSFALENMMRIIRTGSGYQCNNQPLACSPGSSFTVTGSDGNTYIFSSNGDHVTTGAITEKVNAGSTLNITDSSVVVTALNFYLVGPGISDGQTRMTVVATGSINTDPGKQIPFTVETGATIRSVSP